MFRPKDGLRTPYLIVLDRQRNVVFDDVDDEKLAEIKANPQALARHQLQTPPAEKQKVTDAQTGLVRHITDSGIRISREPLDDWGVKFETWLDSSRPSPFDDEKSEALRLEYFRERADTQRRIDEGLCPGCEVNRLQVEYRVKLRKLQGL